MVFNLYAVLYPVFNPLCLKVHFQVLELLAKQMKGFKKPELYHHPHCDKTVTHSVCNSNNSQSLAHMLAFPYCIYICGQLFTALLLMSYMFME